MVNLIFFSIKAKVEIIDLAFDTLRKAMVQPEKARKQPALDQYEYIL